MFFYHNFAKEPHNIGLGLTCYGFNPIKNMNVTQSTWLVIAEVLFYFIYLFSQGVLICEMAIYFFFTKHKIYLRTLILLFYTSFLQSQS